MRSALNIFLSKKTFLYFLIAFNILFLTYVLMVGYYNRLALDDFAYLGIMRDYGFFNPFTYWYFNWQGRFGPQFFLNFMFLFYQATSSLFFYPVVLSSLLIYSFYQILKYYFPLSNLILFNYSILLFSALLLTTFELNTFFWICASVDYFGGPAFALLGIVFILRNGNSFWHYIIIAISFLIAGSSSENVGALGSLLLFLAIFIALVRSAYNSGNFVSHVMNFISSPVNRKLMAAFIFCVMAFVIMVLAPGTNVRLTQTKHITDPVELISKTWDITLFVGAHIFFKLPYIIAFMPLFVVFGTYLKSSNMSLNINFIYVLAFCLIAMLLLLFVSNIPVAYAISQWGPLRSYVYVSFFLVAILFLLGVYTGYRYQSRFSRLESISNLSLLVLFICMLYTFYSEWPLLKKYNETDRNRIAILNEYKKLNRTEPVFVPPLYNPEYVTITDMWRKVTRTDKIPSPMSDMPVLIGEISESDHWRNGHLKAGLGLKFDVYLAPSAKSSVSK